MPGQITVAELEKAARNLERLAQFLGERRAWMLASDAEAAAISVRNAAASLAALLAEMVGRETAAPEKLRQPDKLTVASTVSGSRLAKFAEFIDQLQDWFASHHGSPMPPDSDEAVSSILHSLAVAERSINELMKPPVAAADVSQAVVCGDLGPVAEVDMNARLVLEDSVQTPLLQVFRGVSELTPQAKRLVEEFFAKQGIELEGNDRRRIHDKTLRWIQSTPEGHVLVIKLSGLSGRAEAYSSYRPKQ
jgi:hypothetical protein